MTAHTGSTQDEVRRHNLSTLLSQVHIHGAQSRARLTEAMGLNRSTIKALVDELADAGLVIETIPDAGLGVGRPSHVVSARPGTAYVLAASLGVDTVTVAAVGLGGVISARGEHPLPGPNVDPDVVIGQLGEELRAFQAAAGPRAWLAGVGIGVPGAVRRQDGFVEFAPNLGWRGIPFGSLLADRVGFGVPVSVGNDADLGGVAERLRGAGRGIDHLLFIAGEVGIGGSIVVDGRTASGAHGYGSELGHMIVNPDGQRCRCGSIGCFETEVGEEAVLSACGRDPASGRGGVLEVFAAAVAGEPQAVEGLHHVARWLARGLTSLVNILHPEVIILAGALSTLLELTGDRVKTEMDTLSTFAGRSGVQLLRPGLGEDSSLIGAAEMAFETLLDDPAQVWARQAG